MVVGVMKKTKGNSDEALINEVTPRKILLALFNQSLCSVTGLYGIQLKKIISNIAKVLNRSF